MQVRMENSQKVGQPIKRSLFPNDAKFIQYTYLQQKAKSYLTHVTEIKELVKKDDSLIFDTQIIITLAGVVFNLNDNFYRRSEILQTCQKYNGTQKIEMPPSDSPINFDSLENISRNCSVGPFGIMRGKYVPLPEKRKIFDCIVLLELLLVNVLEITDAKIKSLQTQTKIKLNESNRFLELENIPTLKLSIVPDLDIRQQESISRYYLQSQMQNLRKVNSTYDTILKSCVPKVNNVYGMYNQLLRLADLYAEMRKLGKMVYFQNLNFFEPYQRTRRNVALTLKQLDTLFTRSKQNGMLLTLISRYARRTIIKDIKLDYSNFVAEFKKTASEIHTLISKMLLSLMNLVDDYQSIVDDGKLKEFDKEYIRDKLRKDAAIREQKRRDASIELAKNESIRRETMQAQMDLKRRESMRRLSVSKLNLSANQDKTGTSSSRANSLTRVSRPNYIPLSASSSRNNSLTNNSSSRDHFLNRTDEIRSAGRDLGEIQERDESPVKQLDQQISELQLDGDLSLIKPKTSLTNSKSSTKGPFSVKQENGTTKPTEIPGSSISSRHNSVSNGSATHSTTERTIQRRNSVIVNPSKTNTNNNGSIRRRNSYISTSSSQHVASNYTGVSPLKKVSSPDKQTPLTSPIKQSPMITPVKMSAVTSPSKQTPLTSPIKQSPLSSPAQLSPKLTPNSDSNLDERLKLDPSLSTSSKRGALTASQRFQQSLVRAEKTGSVYRKPMVNRLCELHEQKDNTNVSSSAKSLKDSVNGYSENTELKPNLVLNKSSETSDSEEIDQSTQSVEEFPGRKVKFVGVPAWTPLEDAPSQNGSMGQTKNYRWKVLATPTSPLSVYKEGAIWRESLREEKSQNSGATSAAKRISRMFRR